MTPWFEPSGRRNRFEHLRDLTVDRDEGEGLDGADEEAEVHDDEELHAADQEEEEVHAMGAAGNLHLRAARAARVLLYGAAAGTHLLIVYLLCSPVFGMVAEFVPGVAQLASVLAAATALLAFVFRRRG